MCIQRQVIQFMQSEHLVSAGDIVIVGVSGGPDSLCLLHLLDRYRDRLAIRLHIAHLNHLIRAADADADAQFVADFAAQRGIPCTIERRDVPAIAHQKKLAIEEAARRLKVHIEKEGVLESVKFKYLLDTTRKYAIPLLDYMDKIGVTTRRGNTIVTMFCHFISGASHNKCRQR